jgi:hypothetical protein
MKRFVWMVLLAFAAACGGDDSTGPSNSTSWTYNLKTINCSGLPATIVQVGNQLKVEVTKGFITLNGDKTFSGNIETRTTEGGTVTTEQNPDGGTYTLVNGALQLTSSDGTTASGAVSGNRVTVIFDQGFSAVFEK